MNAKSFLIASDKGWNIQIIRNADLFFEADRLDAAADALIANGFDNPEVWQRFKGAKKVADAKRTVAYVDWIRIRRALEG